ncbi:MAG: hypothetical protein ACI9V1_003021 [Spirosomataceae bacterium]|jgi:hypothetical protein
MHPIKLLDGFTASITENGSKICLAVADSFINYPMANKHIYRKALPGISIEHFQFVPDGKPAVAVEYTFKKYRELTTKI